MTNLYAEFDLTAIDRSSLKDLQEKDTVLGKIGDEEWRIWGTSMALLKQCEDAAKAFEDAWKVHEERYPGDQDHEPGALCENVGRTSNDFLSAQEVYNCARSDFIKSVHDLLPNVKGHVFAVRRDGSIIEVKLSQIRPRVVINLSVNDLVDLLGGVPPAGATRES